MFVFGRKRATSLDPGTWWHQLPAARLATGFARWLGGHPASWSGARLIGRAQQPCVAIQIAAAQPFAGFQLALMYVAPTDTHHEPGWIPALLTDEGASVFEWVRSAWGHREQPLGASTHRQRVGITARRIEGVTVLAHLDGALLTIRDDNPYAFELTSAFSDRASGQLGDDGSLHLLESSTGRRMARFDDVGVLNGVTLVIRDSPLDVFTLDRDEMLRVRRVQLPGGQEVLIDYTEDGRLESMRHSLGEELRLTYRKEAPSEIQTFRHPLLGEWRLNRSGEDGWLAASPSRGLIHTRVDAFNQPLEETLPSGQVTQIERDHGVGSVSIVTVGPDKLECFYDLEGFVVYTDETGGAHAEFETDAVGRLVRGSVPGIGGFRRVFDGQGRLVSVVGDDRAYELRWSDDQPGFWIVGSGSEPFVSLRGGRLASVAPAQPAAGVAGWSLNPAETGDAHWLVSTDGPSLYFTTGALGIMSWGVANEWNRALTRDATGQLLSVSDGTINLMAERDQAGRIVSISGDGGVVQGDAGKVRADASACEITWDATGQMATAEVGALFEERGHTVDGRLTELSRDGASTLTQFETDRGRVIQTTTPGPAATRVALNARGRVSRIGGPPAKPPRGRRRPVPTAPALFRYEYDELDRIVEAERSNHRLALARVGGRRTEERSDRSEVRIARDSTGARVGLSTSLGLKVDLTRERSGRISRLRFDPDGDPTEVVFRYDGAGREISRAAGPVEVQLERDALGHVVKRSISRTGQPIASSELRYRGALLVDIKSDPGWPSNGFEYDPSGMLVAMTDAEGIGEQLLGADDEAPFGYPLESVSYDSVGRPLSQRERSYRFSDAGYLISTVEGQSRTGFQYDALGQLVRREHPDIVVEYERDAFGRQLRRRLQRFRDAPLSDDTNSDARLRRRAMEMRGEHRELARESTLDTIWDGLHPVHRVSSEGRQWTYVWADGVLALLIVDSEPHLVVPDGFGDPAALLRLDGELRWARDPTTLIYGSRDEGAIELGVPSVPEHYLDPETGYWDAAFRTLDSATGRYLCPNPLGLMAGPWLHAGPQDPIRGRMRNGIGRPRVFWDELRAETFALRFAELMVEQLCDPVDERGRRAFSAFDDEVVPDPVRLLLARAGLIEG